jgi:hypothetical protein
MIIKEQLEKLAKEKNKPCVTISLNTHRTFPDNAQDAIKLKNLLREAEDRVVNEFGKRSVSSLLDRLSEIEQDIDVNYNLDSLHIYVSNSTKEILKSTWSTNENAVYISDTFNVRSLIKYINRSAQYLILLLSQSGVRLYNVINDGVLNEIKNEDFPFSENTYYNTHSDKGSDSKHLDDLVREFLNKVDKAVVKVSNELGLNCFVVSTEDNFSRLMQVADKSAIYNGHGNIDYNKTDTNHIAKQGWEKVKAIQHNQRTEAIGEIKEAVGRGNVLTDLQEIYQAAIDGRGDLLMMDEDFALPVNIGDNGIINLEADITKPGYIDDITSNIAWEVLSKNGKVFFTKQDEIKEIGEFVLKTRY